jgi:pyruvate, water dikinase
MFIKEFKQLNKNNADIAGGKGASLGEMSQAGIPVPAGFVVLTSAFDQFLKETDLNVEIDSILHTVKHEEVHTVEQASEQIQGLILGAAMPEDIKLEITKAHKELDAKYVAVRSSATAEDGAEAAWAGQLDSFLNTKEEQVLETVQKCWASLFTPRAIFYRFEKKMHGQGISVAVVIQKMIQSEVSGIAFSVHPVTEDRNQLIIEAALGLGEAIVSGQITPDSYVVEKQPRRIIDKNIITQERGMFKATLRQAQGDRQKPANEWQDIKPEEGEQQVLSDKEILELSEIILKIEKHYGFPVDIEFAREKSKFYIVQSRPITTLSK